MSPLTLMSRPEIDLLKQKSYLRVPKRAPVLFFGRALGIAAVVIVTISIIFSYRVSTTTESSANPNLSLFSTLKQLVSAEARALDGENEDRVNLLIMGIGGEGHDGPQLTDTIIFTSYRPSDDAIGMMSLPRDMSVPIPGYGYRKVNHANAYGEMEKTGDGPALATQVIGDVLDEEIHYYLRVDFDGFAEFVDAIGGVDVYVEQTFTDTNYPVDGKEYDECETEVFSPPNLSIPSDPSVPSDLSDSSEPALADIAPQPEVVIDYSCRFESVTFYEGWTHMDGATALKFVRSRHGNNGEGSDFARATRQQKIILAVKDKMMSASTFLNPSRISKMLDTLENNIATNLNVWEIVRLARELKGMNTSAITNHVIDASPASPLYATVLNGAYVLLPKNDNWSPLQSVADQIFTNDSELNLAFDSVPEEKPKFVRVEIQNGTSITGLALRTSQLLDGQGFDVVKVGNAASREYAHTVIYDLTNGERATELKALRNFLQADVTLSATGWMISGDIVPQEIAFTTEDYEELATESGVDFLVVLGESASSFVRQ
jgi:LCP family protein required for cell wall assembly